MKSIVGDLTLDAVVTNVRTKRRRIQLLLLCLSSDRCLKFISNIHLIFSLIFFNSMFCVDMFVLMICIFLIICGQQVPWGVQTGKNVDLQAIYEIVLRTAWYCLKPGGRFVMLVLRGTKMLWLLWWWWWSLSLWLLPLISQPVVLLCCSVPGLQMMRILRKLSGRYKLLSIQVVRTTNNMPCVIVVEKLEHDLVHETLKHQLYDMSQYVNISPEMYVQSIFVFSSRGLYYFDTFNFRTDQIGQDVLESFWHHSTHLRTILFLFFYPLLNTMTTTTNTNCLFNFSHRYNAVHLETTKDLDMDHDRRNTKRDEQKKGKKEGGGGGNGTKRGRDGNASSSNSTNKKHKK
jgi:hypothetical protein